MLITDDEETLVVNYKKKHRSLIFSEKQKKVLSFWEKKYDPYPDVKPEKKNREAPGASSFDISYVSWAQTFPSFYVFTRLLHLIFGPTISLGFLGSH